MQEEIEVKPLETRGLFEVNGYRVDVDSGTCTCKGFYYGQKRKKNGNKTCKHLMIAEGIK